MIEGHSPCAEAVQLLLPDGARQLDIRLTEKQIEHFGRFCGLLLAANRRFNLTAIDEPTKVVSLHFLDSLSVALALPMESKSDRLSVVDVGAGAGLPGLALALAFRDWDVTLVESMGKRCRFMTSTAESLGVRLRIVCDRVETFGRSESRESFDLAVARAVAPLSVLVEYCGPLVRPGGRLVFYKSGDVNAEISEARAAISELGCRFSRVVAVPPNVVGAGDHCLVVLEKVDHTPVRFPRRVGVARTRPLGSRQSG